MKKKLTLSTALTLIILTAALAVSVTMMIAMRYFNRQVQWVSQRKAMYTYIDDVDQELREHYATLNEETLRQSVVEGFVLGSGDPYAAYFTPQEYVAEQQRLSGYANNVGISVCRDESGKMVVYYVATDSAAEKAGVQVGDVLTAVNSVEIGDSTATEVQRSIDNAEKVLISVQRGETTVAFELSPFRYVVRSVRSRMIGSAGYVRITAFYENTPAQLSEAIAALQKEGATGLVLDLRNNRGGLQSSMQEVISLLMPLGVYGTAAGSDGSTVNLSSNVNAQLGVSTVVLVNSNTAGEAEFIVGAMQEASLATVLGETTAGKGQYQEYISVKMDNSAIKLTAGEYKLLKGGSYQGKGIKPGKEVLLTEKQQAIFPLLTEETDPQLRTALSLISAADAGPQTTTSTTTLIGSTTSTAADPSAADASTTDPSVSTTTTTTK